jgi:acetyl-CoA synthetase
LNDILKTWQDEHHEVSESAVVGFPHDILGEGIYAFVTLKDNVKKSEIEIIEDLKKLVKKQISGYAVPHHFLVKIFNKFLTVFSRI